MFVQHRKKKAEYVHKRIHFQRGRGVVRERLSRFLCTPASETVEVTSGGARRIGVTGLTVQVLQYT
jgi:hypothetical protein